MPGCETANPSEIFDDKGKVGAALVRRAKDLLPLIARLRKRGECRQSL
jgi:hypothetical protein